MNTNKKTARLAGFFYLLVVIFGAFPEKYVRETLIVEAGNAAQTAVNIVANESIFRIALVSDLVMVVAYGLLGLTLYRLLKEVNLNAARVMVAFNLIGVPLIGLNMLNHFAALHVATNAGLLSSFSVEQLNELSLFFMNMHDMGYVIAQISTGTWLIPLGYLIYKSGFMPKLIGILVGIAGIGYLIDLFTQFVLPTYANAVEAYVLTPAAICGELSLMLYLLIVGVRVQQTRRQVALAS